MSGHFWAKGFSRSYMLPKSTRSLTVWASDALDVMINKT